MAAQHAGEAAPAPTADGPELEHISAAAPTPATAADAAPRRRARWWKVRLFRGMVDDVRRRAPYYWSDWTDAWDYRVVPATVYMYFAK